MGGWVGVGGLESRRSRLLLRAVGFGDIVWVLEPPTLDFGVFGVFGVELFWRDIASRPFSAGRACCCNTWVREVGEAGEVCVFSCNARGKDLLRPMLGGAERVCSGTGVVEGRFFVAIDDVVVGFVVDVCSVGEGRDGEAVGDGGWVWGGR